MFHVLVVTHYYQKSPLEPINLYLTCLNHPVNWKTCKVHNLQPFEISNYHLYCTVFVKKKPIPLTTGKIASFTIRQSFSHWHSISKDGQQMTPMQVTLKVGVKCRVITSMCHLCQTVPISVYQTKIFQTSLMAQIMGNLIDKILKEWRFEWVNY